MYLLITVLSAFLLLPLLSCTSSPETQLCVSIPPQAYLVRRIAGESVPLTVMIPPGAAPPTYSPTASQIRDLHQSKLYIKNGHPDFHFEKKHIDPFLKKHPGIMTVDMADSVDIIPGDVHIWLSPRIMAESSERIYRKLLRLYPENEEIYRERYRALRRDIDSLDQELQKTFAPHRGKTFMILHPALAYFCRDYGLEQISIREGNKTPSAKRIAQLIEYGRRENIRVILIQKEFASEQLDMLSREIGAEIVSIDPLSAAWLDNLDETARILERVFNE